MDFSAFYRVVCQELCRKKICRTVRLNTLLCDEKMRSITGLICLISSATAWAEEAVFLGQVIDPSASVTQIRVCGSDEIVQFGVMASNQYFWFMRKLAEESEAGSVLVEVRGERNGDTLERMSILSIEHGACDPAGT